jgi:TetR/AcrR family transcriptional regulator
VLALFCLITCIVGADGLKSVHYKELFNKISEEKRNKILNSAIIEFADHSFDSTNINNIAKKSGISIGAMYSYFGSKEELYATILQCAVETLKSVLDEIMLGDEDLLGKISRIIKSIQQHSRSNVHLTKLYCQMTSENRTEFIYKVVSEIEGVTAGLYTALLNEAQKSGSIRKDIDTRLFAFFLDNLFISLQFSYSCEYYKKRLEMFVDEEVFKNDDLVAEQLLKFIKGALC